MTSHRSLLSPGRIGPMELKNRILLTSMGAGMAEADGTSGERIRRFHEQHARGGAALVTMGVVGVALPLSQNMINQPAISDDRYIPGLKAVADTVHSHGAKFAVQLHFAGLVAAIDMVRQEPLWTPSIPEYLDGDMRDGFLKEEQEASPSFNLTAAPTYRVMTKEDIDWLVGKYAAGAARAREVGVDGIELHAGHGYLLSSFISPATNKRTDEYGGSVENRSRILCEVISAIRDAAGPDIAVWCKIDAIEYERKGGITLDDAKATARLAQEAGAQAITITAYHETSRGVLHSASHTPDQPGLNVDKARAIKDAVTVPIIVSGRIETEEADRIIDRGDANFIAMGRKLLADPSLPNKLAQGRPEEVLPCIYCYTCISSIYVGGTVRCAVNPETAFELVDWMPPVANARHVLVIGGGPAGMEAARRLAERGHRITLVEQSDVLGGTLRFAALAYEPNQRILEWLRRQVKQSAIDVRLQTSASLALVKELAPDEIVVASGARRDMPPIPGRDLPHVFSGDDLRNLMLGEQSAELREKTSTFTRLIAKAGKITGANRNIDVVREATRAWMPLGKNVVIIGGELVGLELAEFLVERGRNVTVIDDAAKMGAGLPIVRRWRVLDNLRSHGVPMLTSAQDIAIEKDRVTARDADAGPIAVPADNVIVAKGATADRALANELQDAGYTVHEIGDSTGVSYIEGAMRSAAEVARVI